MSRGASWHTDQWILSGGGWDGDAEAIHRLCGMTIQIRWGRVIRDLQTDCAVHETLCPAIRPDPKDDP